LDWRHYRWMDQVLRSHQPVGSGNFLSIRQRTGPPAPSPVFKKKEQQEISVCVWFASPCHFLSYSVTFCPLGREIIPLKSLNFKQIHDTYIPPSKQRVGRLNRSRRASFPLQIIYLRISAAGPPPGFGFCLHMVCIPFRRVSENELHQQGKFVEGARESCDLLPSNRPRLFLGVFVYLIVLPG
jgi:hypothetical protein